MGGERGDVVNDGMLAYVFWHWKRADVDAAVYEERQRRFHAALAAARPPGFQRSFSVAIAGAPWAAAGGDAYEDWYLVDGYAALGHLNQGAVSASRAEPHDAAAAVAAGGAGGLYALKAGRPPAEPGHAWWFGKPDGMAYDDLFAALQGVVADGALWQRQMVLGPAPEFCLHGKLPLALPERLEATGLTPRAVWREDDHRTPGAGRNA